ncbi:hypothetical protein [Caulobacter segnis]
MASTQTDTRERVDVAEGGEPAAADVDTGEAKAVEQSAPPRRLTTFERMAAILDECDAIGKQDIQMEKDGKKWSIKGHTVEAVLSEIRPLFSKHGLSIMPSLVERSYAGNRCDVIIDWKFRALDDRDDIEIVRWAGAGTDNGDKAFSKAGTNCLKEMLKKTFLVSDRDDAKEEEDKVEHQTEEAWTRAEMERQAEAKHRVRSLGEGLQEGGRDGRIRRRGQGASAGEPRNPGVEGSAQRYARVLRQAHPGPDHQVQRQGRRGG